MRSLVVLALGLGLFAVAQAAELQAPVWLKGLPSDEEMASDVSVLGRHRHWRRHGHPHDPHDAPYWEKRHSVKADLIRCLERAAEGFDKTNSETWVTAGEAAARCFLEHLHGCHDAPGIADEVTRTVPWLMFVNGLHALADPALQNTGLLHAIAVFEFYAAGAVATVPTPEGPVTNPWYVPGGCASRLANLLQSGCHNAKKTEAIWVLAKLVAKLIESADQGWGPYADCVADIPAVIISMVSTQCPQRGYLYNPLNRTRIPCWPVPDRLTYENSAGALLGGSIYTALLLSGNAKLYALGVQVGFAINRQALAATQTTNFAQCLDSKSTPSVPFPGGIDYNGQLNTTLKAIPERSGAVLPTGDQAYTPLALSPDGQRVICASIAMMSGDPFTLSGVPDPTYKWDNNLLWQGSANTANAVFKTVAEALVATPPGITTAQKDGLCAVATGIYRFTTTKPPSTVVTIPGAVAALGEQNWACMTDSNPVPNCPVPLPFLFGIEPVLAVGHSLESTSFIGTVCKWA